MIADDVAARIRSQVTGLTVYAHAVPNVTPPRRYVVVQAAAPTIDSDDLGTSQTTREHSVWVRTFSSDDDDDQVAVNECAWAAEKADAALARWRVNGWLPLQTASSPARRDDDQPDKRVAYASSVWTIRTA